MLLENTNNGGNLQTTRPGYIYARPHLWERESSGKIGLKHTHTFSGSVGRKSTLLCIKVKFAPSRVYREPKVNTTLGWLCFGSSLNFRVTCCAPRALLAAQGFLSRWCMLRLGVGCNFCFCCEGARASGVSLFEVGKKLRWFGEVWGSVGKVNYRISCGGL